MNTSSNSPEDSAQFTRLRIKHENVFLLIEEHLEELVNGINFESDSPDSFDPAQPYLLPLITFFQFIEELNDEHALDSLQLSIQWKEALHLPIDTPNLKPSFLCAFRRQLINNPVSKTEFQEFLDKITDLALQDLNPLTINVEQLIFEVCTFNIRDLAFATTIHVFETLEATKLEWLQKNALPIWWDRYLFNISQYNVLFPIKQQNISLQEILQDDQFLLRKLQLSGLDDLENLEAFTALKRICKLGSLPTSHSSTQVGNYNCDLCDMYPIPRKGDCL
jgi:hypothetical protein